jgi:hypothetical protein
MFKSGVIGIMGAFLVTDLFLALVVILTVKYFYDKQLDKVILKLEN